VLDNTLALTNEVPTKSLAALVDWCGPFSREEALPASFDYEDGLYMVTGKLPYQRTVSLQYIGLASLLSRRLTAPHHKIGLVTKDTKLWIGSVASPRTPGRKIKVTDKMLDLVVWAHIYYLQLPLNSKKRATPPDYPIMILNRWWTQDGEKQRRQRPHSKWPDLIDVVGEEYKTKIVWFGGRQTVTNWRQA